MNIPGNRRVMLADLALIDADVGSRVWVEGTGQYEAVPRDQKATNAIDGPADALTPISWQPEGMAAVTPAGTVARSTFGNAEGWSAAPATYVFAPSGTSDDWARLQALADSLIDTGSLIQFAPGTYRITTQLNVKQGHPNMKAGPECKFIVALEKVQGQNTPATLFFSASLSVTTTVTVAAARGQRTLVVDSIAVPVIADGSTIEPENGAQYEVIGAPVASGNDWALTLDRPLVYPVEIGRNVRVCPTHMRDWEFDYAGATITGDSSRYWSISRAQNCVIKNAIITNEEGVADCIGSWDNAGRLNRFENIQYRSLGGTDPNDGLLCETNEGTQFINCNLGKTGFHLDTDWNCTLTNCSGEYHYFESSQAPYAGGHVVNGGLFNRMQLGSTVDFAGSVNDITMRDVKYLSNTSLVALCVNVVNRVLFDKCLFELPQTPAAGFVSAIVVPGLKFRDCKFTANRAAYTAVAQADRSIAVTIGSAAGTHEVEMEGCSVADMTSISVLSGTSKIRVKNCTFDTTMVGNGVAVPPLVIAGTACDFVAEDMRLVNPEAPGYAAVLSVTHGHYRLHNSSSPGYFWGSAGESSVRLTGTSVGAVNVNTVSSSPGVATIAGASIAVAFYAARAGEVPRVTQLSGTATPFTVVVSAGVGFTITGEAGTYGWSL